MFTKLFSVYYVCEFLVFMIVITDWFGTYKIKDLRELITRIMNNKYMVLRQFAVAITAAGLLAGSRLARLIIVNCLSQTG